MSRRLAFVVLMAVLATISIAKAAPTFDDQWKGEGKPTSSCGDTAVVTFTIKDGDFIAFSFTGPKGSTTIVKGRIPDNGMAAIEYGRTALKGTLQFQGNSFLGKMDSLCGVREVAGQRIS